MEPVNRKLDFVRRFIDGEFGNRTPTWWALPDYDGVLCFRSLFPGAKTFYDVQPGTPLPPGYYVSAMIPKNIELRGLLQGEVYRSPKGLSLFYSHERVAMKPALERGIQTYGLTAQFLLQRYLNARSYEWLQYLLDTYDGHVVEFSAYEVEYGMLRGFNTLFWEVRHY